MRVQTVVDMGKLDETEAIDAEERSNPSQARNAASTPLFFEDGHLNS